VSTTETVFTVGSEWEIAFFKPLNGSSARGYHDEKGECGIENPKTEQAVRQF
jgi:hypothetical protein